MSNLPKRRRARRTSNRLDASYVGGAPTITVALDTVYVRPHGSDSFGAEVRKIAESARIGYLPEREPESEPESESSSDHDHEKDHDPISEREPAPKTDA